MADYTLPKIWTVKEVADYLRVNEETIIDELKSGSLHGFRIGEEWRCSDVDLLTYIGGQRNTTELHGVQMITAPTQDEDWEIFEIEPFDFNWPKEGGGSNTEHYDKGYEATRAVNGREYTFRIGFGNRESAGKMRRRITIWLGNRAVVEFAGSNNYENDGLLAGIIRLKNGRQLSIQRIPEEYRGFRIERYNSIVHGPRASGGMAVVVHKDDLKSMLEHAVIRAMWKELI